MPDSTPESTAPQKATRREWLGLAVLGLGALVYVMDPTVLHLAVPKMSADLQPTSAARGAGDRPEACARVLLTLPGDA